MKSYYNACPTCPFCKKRMICAEETKRERREHLKGYEYYETYKEFVCGDCSVSKKYTNTRTLVKDD